MTTENLAVDVRTATMEDPERSGGERSEAPRSGGSSMVERAVSPAPHDASLPDPELSARPKRRRFTAEYKLRILREADACKEPGEVGALLRREGLYSSHLVVWRRQRDKAAGKGMRANKRGPKPKLQDPRVRELERETIRLQRRLKRAETIIEIQKKVAEILGIPLKNLDSEDND